MPKPTVSILHVEDDVMLQRLLKHHLRAVSEFDFDIRYADTEKTAIEVFDKGGIEFVILDYQLSEGDGLSCVRELRQRDAIVPIVAVSGAATPEIASELLEGGADDYIEKKDLTSEVLARSVRETLTRANACRQQQTRSRDD